MCCAIILVCVYIDLQGLQVGTIIRSLNIFPTEKQLQHWIIQIEEEEPTGFIVYEKVYPCVALSSSHVECCADVI